MDRIICVVGPTASGKTKLAVQLAKLYDGEVVSCDSMQIYKHMDIGTAKPTKEEMEGVAHHLIDMVEPGEDFSAGKYVQLADACVQDILSRGKTAVIAGGTGLYVDSLIAGRSFAPVPQTGRPELSASVGIKGLQPVIRMSMGMSLSRKAISANGNRDVNCPLSKRGMPRSVCPFPRPELGRPNFFQSGHLISRTLEPFFTPFKWMAANMPGSLKKSMWWRTDM